MDEFHLPGIVDASRSDTWDVSSHDDDALKVRTQTQLCMVHEQEMLHADPSFFLDPPRFDPADGLSWPVVGDGPGGILHTELPAIQSHIWSLCVWCQGSPNLR